MGTVEKICLAIQVFALVFALFAAVYSSYLNNKTAKTWREVNEIRRERREAKARAESESSQKRECVEREDDYIYYPPVDNETSDS